MGKADDRCGQPQPRLPCAGRQAERHFCAAKEKKVSRPPEVGARKTAKDKYDSATVAQKGSKINDGNQN